MAARLHHERVAGDAAPARWLLFAHGIFGAGSNWRGIARKLTERRPAWGVVLVDLRQHGRSEPGTAPHTLAAIADDVRALARELGGVEALAGHSFGGKVMLAARAVIEVRQTWVLDASPSRRPDAMTDADNSVVGVLDLLERLPRTWGHRDEFIAEVTGAGHDRGVAQWLAMNLVPDARGVPTLRLDTAALREMLRDYYAQDLWDSLRDPARGDVELVIAQRAHVFTADDRARLATAPPHVHLHELDAGHWLNVEAPGPVVDLLVTHLP